jgi:O-antigen/teichoic acid export membrane protein
MEQSPVTSRRQTARSILLKNITSNWMSLLINTGVSFCLSPYVVNRLGSLYYGIWALLGEFTGYLWLFDFGVRESIIKFVAQYHATGENEQLERTVNAALFMYMGIAALAFVASLGMALVLPFVFSIPPESVTTARWTLILTGAAIAQGFVFNVFIGVLMGLQRYYMVVRMSVVFTMIRAGLIVAALSNGLGLVALGAIQLIVGTMVGVMVVIFTKQSLPWYRPRVVRPAREELTRVFGYAKYVFGNNIGEKVVFRTDALIIGIFLPVASLAYYAIAGSLVKYMQQLVFTMASVLNPVSSTLDAKGDSSGLRVLFLSSSKAAVLIGLPVAIGFEVLGTAFIGLWMGPAYAETAGQILAVLAATHLLGLPHFCALTVLYGLGKHSIMAKWRAVEAVANLGISIVLVQRYGLIGVALGTLISHVVIACVILPHAMTRLLDLRLRDYYVSTYVRPFIAGLPFAAACYFIAVMVAPASLAMFFVSVAAALPIYAAGCWLVALSSLEREIMLEHMARVLPFMRRFKAEKAAPVLSS